jgi:hypothetical protein
MRWWIALQGKQSRRTTQLVFKLRRRGLVHVVVRQVSPFCRVAARFSVGGHAGVNRVRIGGGLHGAQLSPGTYRITGRTRAGRVVLNVTVVVVGAQAPTMDQLDAARRSNVCNSTSVLGPTATRGSLAFATGVAGGKKDAALARSTIVRHQRRADAKPKSAGPSSAHIGNVIAADVSAAAKRAANPVVIALLALAVFTFGVAALPRTVVADPRLMAAVVSHRSTLALAGMGALVAAAIAMLLA